MRNSGLCSHTFPLLDHRYLYVIFTLYLDIYFIGLQWKNGNMGKSVRTLAFSQFCIFAFFHGKIRKKVKMRKFCRNFAFSYFHIFSWKFAEIAKKRKCEISAKFSHFRIFAKSHFFHEKMRKCKISAKFLHFRIFAFVHENMRKSDLCSHIFPLSDHRYLYVVFNLQLDVYFIGLQMEKMRKCKKWDRIFATQHVCIFAFFPWKNAKMRKCEKEKICPKFRIFAFLHFTMEKWENAKMLNCENQIIFLHVRIFPVFFFSWKKWENLVMFMCLLHWTTRPFGIS